MVGGEVEQGGAQSPRTSTNLCLVSGLGTGDKAGFTEITMPNPGNDGVQVERRESKC